MFGMISSLCFYGVTLEYATSKGRDLDELNFVFVTTLVYAMVAYFCRELTGEKLLIFPKCNYFS